MTEDLLEEIDRETGGPGQDAADSDKPAGKFAFLRKLLFFKGLTGKKKLIAIIAAAVFVLVLAVAGAWFFFFSGEEEKAAPPVQEVEKKEEIVFEDIVVMEPFERIPMKTGSAMNFISLDLSLELSDHRYRRQVYTVQDRLRRIVEVQVKNASWLELRTPEGKIKLKYEMLRQMNKIFPKVTIRNIYFTNFLMQ
ncbi:MAG: flagellar basal body-associated FliL family protein [Desulfobacter sp.]|nr:MAG: flagellar basal body-associated FliL family protein [Desulfobacter sp.]